MSKIGIIGAGAWGTSLATVMRRAGNEVVLQAHEPAQLRWHGARDFVLMDFEPYSELDHIAKFGWQGSRDLGDRRRW